MTIDVTQRPTRIEVSGDLDLDTGDDLEATAAGLLRRGERMTIGLREVPFADSSGIGALLAVRHRADEVGAELVLDGVSGHVRRVLELTGVTDQFHIAPSSGPASGLAS